jgi:hypothetical protein
VLCVRYEINLSVHLSVYLVAGMLCRKESYHDSSAVQRCIWLRTPLAMNVLIEGSEVFICCVLKLAALQRWWMEGCVGRPSPLPLPLLCYVSGFSSCTTFSVVNG